MVKFSSFTTKNYSQIIDDLIKNNIYLTGVDLNTSDNIKINFLELLTTAEHLGTGAKVVNSVDGRNIKFKTLKGSSNVNISETENELTFSVNNSAIPINNLSGILELNKGGLGADILEPEGIDALLGYLNSESSVSFLELGTNLSIDGNTLNANNSSGLTTKGDLLTFSTEDTRLPVGSDTQILEADSTQPLGLKWADKPINSDEKLKVDSDAVAGYLGVDSSSGVLRTTSKLIKEDFGDYVRLDLVPSNINLSELQNDTEFEKYYDSGWLNVPNLVDSNMTNVTNPLKFRVLNRTVLFKGDLVIPLDNGLSGYVSDYSLVGSTYKDVVTATQYTVDDEKIQTPIIFSSSVLRPDVNKKFTNKIASRIIEEKNTSSKIHLNSFIPQIELKTTGELEITSLNGLGVDELPLTASITTKADVDDYALTFDSTFKNSANGDGSLNNVPVKSTLQYPVTIDATKANNLGGFLLNMDNVYYTIAQDTEINTIKTAIDLL